MKKTFIILLIAVFLCLAPSLVSCDKAERVDYSKDNSYAYTVENGDDALVYSPDGVSPTYGLIFYVGTMIGPENYAYLGEALARQGFLAVFPNEKFGLAFLNYRETETAYDRFPGVKFFLGGHSQGGGAAIRRAQENAASAVGLVLFAPLCYLKGGGVFTGAEDGEDDDYFYSVADSPIPSLILSAQSDRVLTEAQKGAVLDCVDLSLAETRVISPGSHMSFSTWDSDRVLNMFNGDGDGITEDGKAAQRAATASYVLSFMQRVAIGA